jgi:hypothetical protein
MKFATIDLCDPDGAREHLKQVRKQGVFYVKTSGVNDQYVSTVE